MDEIIETYVNNTRDYAAIDKLYELFDLDINYYECNDLCGEIEFINDIDYETAKYINTFLVKVHYPYNLVFKKYSIDRGETQIVFKRDDSEKYNHIELKTAILIHLLKKYNIEIRGELNINPADSEPFILSISSSVKKKMFISHYSEFHMSYYRTIDQTDPHEKIFKVL
jgi:hypothetical protein